jgi:hypothetical protein
MMTSILACDLLTQIDYIVENQSSDAIQVILKTNQMNDTLEIPAGSDYKIGFDEKMGNSVNRMYSQYGDTLVSAIIDIQKNSIACSKNWHLKNNWQYDKVDQRGADLRFVVEDSDF